MIMMETTQGKKTARDRYLEEESKIKDEVQAERESRLYLSKGSAEGKH